MSAGTSPDPTGSDAVRYPTEQERAVRASVLGFVLGIALAALGRDRARSRPGA